MHSLKRTSRSFRRATVVAGVAAVGLIAAVGAFAVGPLGSDDRSAALVAEIDPAKPRNVILLIGDGTDESIITAARNYELGANGRWALDNLPFVGDMTVHGLKTGPGPDYPFNYVSDSAPTATAWSTGKKTVDSRVGQGPSTALNVPGEDYETVLEMYKDEGRRVGNVTTSEITDATPAAAGSHINDRGCQGPTNMAGCTAARKVNGGKGSIAEQLVDNEIDVLLGGGRGRYTQTTDAGPTVLDYAKNTRDYVEVADKTALAAIDSLDDGPVLGLFHNSNMTPLYSPLVATAPPGSGSDSYRCTEANRGNEPSLAEMTSKAIELLDSPEGFFLQVESAMVDKQEHASDVCGAMGDVKVLDEALQVALDYQLENPDTLIIVTADHSHSTQIVPNNGAARQTATVQTADGDPMYLGFSTQASGSSHTGSTVRVAAKGPQAANVTGLIDQTDLFETLLGRTPSVIPTPEPPDPEPLQPRASIAVAPSIKADALKKQGLTIAIATADAINVKVELLKGNSRINGKNNVNTTGATVKLKTSKVKNGTLKVRVTATGPGGTTTATKTVKVKK